MTHKKSDGPGKYILQSVKPLAFFKHPFEMQQTNKPLPTFFIPLPCSFCLADAGMWLAPKKKNLSVLAVWRMRRCTKPLNTTELRTRHKYSQLNIFIWILCWVHIGRSETGGWVCILQYFTLGWNNNVRVLCLPCRWLPSKKLTSVAAARFPNLWRQKQFVIWHLFQMKKTWRLSGR